MTEKYPKDVINCRTCRVLLSFDPKFDYIQCPNCNNIYNKDQPERAECINCKLTLGVLPGMKLIQCPKCLEIMWNGEKVVYNE